LIETVWLDKKTIAGLSARTGNKAPDMGKIIGGLWKRLFEEGVISDIQNRSNDRIIGLYSDYETYTGDFEEYYTGHDGMPKEAHIYVAVK